ncbi:hypothetical protein CCM_00273 [Cordyceps militaris CM01]|uniref:Uncharacterized protein n=1 Tax=Cordyceps militaris (strain CM01) TaxID=983644 RepID=G3J336_CORMM|nr:uncharacterized protein CCM_00273 [Cordyceps militaris CM01]EGX95619.1 hypothetical protein CCM_00273 [Cordyceps militaris CM01]
MYRAEIAVKANSQPGERHRPSPSISFPEGHDHLSAPSGSQLFDHAAGGRDCIQRAAKTCIPFVQSRDRNLRKHIMHGAARRETCSSLLKPSTSRHTDESPPSSVVQLKRVEN